MIDVTRVGLVTTIERIVEHVFMQALAHPAADADDDHAHWPAVRNQLLPSLRSFCSALRGTNLILLNLLCLKSQYYPDTPL